MLDENDCSSVEITIHRGADEIGGTCIELTADGSTILLDLGLPLSEDSKGFDVMNLAPDISCPTLVTVGLEDTVCPPSTVFAAYNHIRSPKQIDVFRYYKHEIPEAHSVAKFRWANHYLRGLGAPPLEA